jgi:hypothetical protein
VGAAVEAVEPRVDRHAAGVAVRAGAAVELRRPGRQLDDGTRRASKDLSGGDFAGMPTLHSEEPARPFVPTRLAYELSHVVDGHSARHGDAGVSLADSGRPPVGGVGGVQAALQVTPPGDRTEAQARRFASTGGWGSPVSPGGALPVPGASLPAVQAAIRGPGIPLDGQARRELEPALGADLGAVRVHTNVGAADSARALGAKAYTVGTNIVFAPGRYQPATGDGRRLLAHEIAHVRQQAASGTAVLAADVEAADVFWGVVGGAVGVVPATQVREALGSPDIDLLEVGARMVLGDTIASVLREFLIGFREGLAAKPEQMQTLAKKFSGFGIADAWSYANGFAEGVLAGLWHGFTGLVEMVVALVELPVKINLFVSTKLPQLVARYGPRLTEAAAKIGELWDRLGGLLAALIKNPAAMDQLIETLRTAALARVHAGGREAAAKVVGFLNQGWYKIGEAVGELVGRILFEVLLALGTDLIGNLLEATGKLVGKVTAWIVEEVVEVLRTLGRLIGEAVEWLYAAGRQFAGDTGKLFEEFAAALRGLGTTLTELLHEGPLAEAAGGIKVAVRDVDIAKPMEARALNKPSGKSPTTGKTPATGTHTPPRRTSPPPPRPGRTLHFAPGGVRYQITIDAEAEAAFRAIPPGRTVVYTILDSDGNVIYVGISEKTARRTAVTRLNEHLYTKEGEFVGEASELRIVGHYEEFEAHALEQELIDHHKTSKYNKDRTPWNSYVKGHPRAERPRRLGGFLPDWHPNVPKENEFIRFFISFE